MAGPGRAGSGRAGSSRISVLHRKKNSFCSMNHIAEINISKAFRNQLWYFFYQSDHSYEEGMHVLSGLYPPTPVQSLLHHLHRIAHMALLAISTQAGEHKKCIFSFPAQSTRALYVRLWTLYSLLSLRGNVFYKIDGTLFFSKILLNAFTGYTI